MFRQGLVEQFMAFVQLLRPNFFCIQKMDRTWIRATRFSDEYTAGVDKFMSFVRDRFSPNDAIRCPYRNCLN